jgi:hypothetical protein
MLTITIGLIISIYVVISSIQISNGSKDSIDEAKHGGFAQHLADAGYELTEIKMNVGLIPDVTSTYKMVRELSEADRRAVERTLKIEDRRNPGFFADLRRQIIRTLLAVSATGEMRVSTLHVGVLPLPSADFTIESPDRPMADDLQGLLRAIKSECRPQPEQHAPARGERR